MRGYSALQRSHLIAVNEVDEEPDFFDGIDGQSSHEGRSRTAVNGTYQPLHAVS
jgi:hypothetical protein